MQIINTINFVEKTLDHRENHNSVAEHTLYIQKLLDFILGFFGKARIDSQVADTVKIKDLRGPLSVGEEY